jgi:large subunit ribosomal protein L22
MPVKVHLNNLRTAPRKVMLVVDLIRGLTVEDAMQQLKYMPQRAAVPITKLIQSAVAAAQNDFKMNKDDLFISRVTVDTGATLKRSMPRAMGRAFPISKRTSNITLELDKKNIALESLEEKKVEDAGSEVKEVSEKKVKNKKAKNKTN